MHRCTRKAKVAFLIFLGLQNEFLLMAWIGAGDHVDIIQYHWTSIVNVDVDTGRTFQLLVLLIMFLFYALVVLNVFTGQIIDSFSTLREVGTLHCHPFHSAVLGRLYSHPLWVRHRRSPSQVFACSYGTSSCEMDTTCAWSATTRPHQRHIASMCVVSC